MRCTGRRSVGWRFGVVVGFALASAAEVAAGFQSAEDALHCKRDGYCAACQQKRQQQMPSSESLRTPSVEGPYP